MMGMVIGPERFQRIAVNETIEATASTAPNSRMLLVYRLGVLGSGPIAGGEDVDVGLDALIGVVDRVVDEARAVVRLAVEPVPGEPIGQPYAPPQDEPLHEEQIEHDPGDEDGGQDREDGDE